MRKSGFLATSAMRSAAFIGLIAAATSPAIAQDSTAGTDAPGTLQSEQEIESGQNATAGAQGESADGQASP